MAESALVIVGMSHKTAPIEVRERVAFPEGTEAEALAAIAQLAGVSEAFLISTCNRVEIYATLKNGSAEQLEHFLIEQRGLPSSMRSHLYRYSERDALGHLFRVCSSLDSMVVGESQILGQMKQAYAKALDAGSIGSALQRTLPRAFSVAKRVRSETDVARSSASIASAAVDLTTQIFGQIEGRSVLCLGAGKMGTLSAKHLKSAGVGELHVLSRTLERAERVAAELGGRAAPWQELDRLLTQVDIVLCSTGATEPVILADRIKPIMKARRGAWLFFIDIAVPRDVHPDVGKIENVFLYDVDELDKIAQSGKKERTDAAIEGEKIIAAELERFYKEQRHEGVVPIIVTLRERCLQMALKEAERASGRLSDGDRQVAAQLAESIVNKLLHAPLTALKRAAADEDGETLAAAVRMLFDLDSEKPKVSVADGARDEKAK